MAENTQNSQINPDEISLSGNKHFSLIDLLMIIMVVGLIAMAIFPRMQDQKNEKIILNSLEKMQMIVAANEKMKVETGDYAFDLSMLNLGDTVKDEYFEFTLNDTAAVATSTKLSINEVSYYFMIKDQKYRVRPDSKEIIDENIFDKIKK